QAAGIVVEHADVQIDRTADRQLPELVEQVPAADHELAQAESTAGIVESAVGVQDDPAPGADAPAVVVQQAGDGQCAIVQRNHGWWRIATACLTVRSRIRAIAVAGNGHRASTIRAGLASGTRLDVADATAIPVRERAGIELQPLDADLLDRAIAIAQRCRSDLHAHGIERAAAVVDVPR